jgi:hypothetical protein
VALSSPLPRLSPTTQTPVGLGLVLSLWQLETTAWNHTNPDLEPDVRELNQPKLGSLLPGYTSDAKKSPSPRFEGRRFHANPSAGAFLAL